MYVDSDDGDFFSRRLANGLQATTPKVMTVVTCTVQAQRWAAAVAG
jgi:hypothetical protein